MTEIVPLNRQPKVRLIRHDRKGGREHEATITVMIGEVSSTMTLEAWTKLLSMPERYSVSR